jgi:hypothetical protein
MFVRKFLKIFIVALITISAFSLSDSNLEASGVWSQFGRLAYIAFEQSASSDSDIMVWDADTDWENGRKMLVRLDGILEQDECNQRDPSLSANGKWLAFATDCDFYGYNPDFQYWIAIINLEDPGEWYPMTIGRDKNANFHARNPTWDPTGSKLAFDANVGGERKIYYINVFDQIDAAAAGSIAEFRQAYGGEAWDPDWAPDGNFIGANSSEGAIFVWTDNFDSNNRQIISQHSGHDTDGIGGVIAIRSTFRKNDYLGEDIVQNWSLPNWDVGNGQSNCDPRSELFAYHTDGHVSGDGEHDVDDGSLKIVVVCAHNMDDKTPEHVTDNLNFATYSSHQAGSGCCIALFPEASPDGRGLAYVTDNGQIMTKIYYPGQYESGHFADDNRVRIDNISLMGTNGFGVDSMEGSPISWSWYEKGLDGGEGALEIGVGAIGLKVDVGGGVNDIFKQEESLEDQYDKQVQLEIDRINSYIAELEYIRESDLKMLDLEIDNYMQQHNQNMTMNNSVIEDVKYEWEFKMKDMANRHSYDLADFDETTAYDYQWKKDDLSNWETFEFERSLQQLESNKKFEEEEDRIYYTEQLQSIDYDYQNRSREINNRLDDYLVYLDGYWNDIIQQNIQDGDQESVDYHNKRKTRDKQDVETDRQRELEDAFSENQRSIWDLEDWKTFEDADRESRFANNKEVLIRDNTIEKTRREQEIESYLEDREMQKAQMLERQNFELEDYNLRAESSLQDVQMNIEYGNQQMNMELERREMQWDLKKQQIQLDYENQFMDYQRQIDEVTYRAEIEKQRLSMDQAQLETEMIQMQNDLNSRQNDVNNFYDSSMSDLENESNYRLDEIERRKADEGWSDERYQQELSNFDKWYFERQYEIQSEYDNSQRDIEFDQRQYENFSTVVETNELYQDGERGFFGNPMPGTIRQGGITDNLSDPGTLAMIGIVVTVGTTFLQLFRGK